MADNLLESDFLTVNISSMFKKTNTENTANNVDETNIDKNASTKSTSGSQKTDWAKELANSLEQNKKLTPEAREKEYTIEQRFWPRYFTEVWGKEYADILLKFGSRLQNDIKALGFVKSKNPIIAFLSLPYVKTELLQTGLLNARTYTAISTAVQKRLVADTEFYKRSKYNIIYCRDLYSKSSDEIIKYLTHQKHCLTVTDGKYTVKTQNENKRVFLQLINKKYNTTDELVTAIKEISDEKLSRADVTSKNAKLNTLTLADKLNHNYSLKNDDLDSNTQTNKKANINIEKLVNKLDTTNPAEILAVMQYLSMTTGIEEAKKALNHKMFSDIALYKLQKATIRISDIFSKVSITKDKAKELVAQLLNTN